MICIICALDIEYIGIKQYLDVNNEYQIADDCWAAECNDCKVVVIKSTIGKQPARECTEYVIGKYDNISCIISAGIAGSLSSNLKIGDIVSGNRVIDYTKEKTTKLSKSMYHLDFDIYTEMARQCGGVCYKDENINFHKGKIISSDIIINNSSLKKQLYKEYKAYCVEMESAGIIEECNRANIPFFAVKVISDAADNRAIISMYRTQNHVKDILGKVLYGVLQFIIYKKRLINSLT